MLSILIFIVTVGMIVLRVVEESLAALLGASLILLLGLIPFDKAFCEYIDWNIILILIGMWTLASLLTRAGLPEYLMFKVLRFAKSYKDTILLLSFLAGIISMFVDNVLVVLLFVPVVISMSKYSRINPLNGALLVTLSANFMGTALLLGDLPPQMLHGVAGAEFLDFIFMQDRPSSFPILMVSFIITLLLTAKILIKEDKEIESIMTIVSHKEVNKKLMNLTLLFFIAVIVLMSLRREISNTLAQYFRVYSSVEYELKLGVIALTMAILAALTIEALLKLNKLKAPSFREIIEGIGWNVVLFYTSLFVVVGALEYQGVLLSLAKYLQETIISSGTSIGCTVLYWLSGALSGFVEHDVYILTMLYALRDLHGLGALANPWPYYWSLLWASTLGSNLTAAGAPAIYVAIVLLRKEGLKISPLGILKVTITYTLISLVVTYILAYIIWFA